MSLSPRKRVRSLVRIGNHEVREWERERERNVGPLASISSPGRWFTNQAAGRQAGRLGGSN